MLPYHSCIQHCNLRLHLSGFDLALQFSATVAIYQPLNHRRWCASLAADVGSLAVGDVCEQNDMQRFPRQACKLPRFTLLRWLDCAHTRQTPEAEKCVLSSSLVPSRHGCSDESLSIDGITQYMSRTLNNRTRRNASSQFQ